MSVVLKSHRSDNPDLLVCALCDVIATPLGDPFATEVVSVPTRGIERWLTERIASTFAERGIGDGVSANVDFPFPSRLVNDILAKIPDTSASIDAWTRRAVVVQVQEIIDAHRDAEWMRLVSRFVRGHDDSTSSTQRLRAAQKIERLFSSYQRYRPEMITAWTGNDDLGADGSSIAEAASWQPRLWRILREEIGVPPLLETLPIALESLSGGSMAADLPERVSVYGLTALDPMVLQVLEAMGATTDVHMFLLHPSPGLWQATAQTINDAVGERAHVRRGEDHTRDAASHPLLRSWAQESRELQVLLGPGFLDSADIREAPAAKPTTLLEALQSDIRANRSPSPVDDSIGSNVVAGSDRSIQIHACHGASRQSEVLRDALLHVFNDDPTLEPRDVVIMTPDLETFGPLVRAAFPTSREGDSGLPDLRVRIADRSPARTNPLVRIASTVVDLASSRLTASSVMSLIAVPEVQRRFGLDIDSVGEMIQLIEDANVRWGLDAEHRDSLGGGSRDEHTWRRGIDRVLTGVFFDDDATRVVGGTAPLVGIEGGSTSAAGYLAHVIERLEAINELLSTPAPASQWPDRIDVSVRLLATHGYGDEWQRSQLRRLLEDTFAPQMPSEPDPVLSLGEAAILITPWAEDTPSRLHHRSGDITVCALPPMRSIPFRVVCVLGLDHDRFPRTGRNDGDDLLVDDEVIGDRDRAAEDRQLLLDAVMAAGDHLLITYSGRDALTNAVLPAAVPVSELCETIDAMVSDGAAAAVVTEHPLQPFSSMVFTDAQLGVPGPWGFDTVQFAGASAVAKREVDSGLVPAPVVAVTEPETPTLANVIAYLKSPSSRFLRHNTGMYISDIDDPPDDDLPTDLDGLEKWSLANRFLAGMRVGHDNDMLVERERASDSVPAGRLADAFLEDALGLAERIGRAALEVGCFACNPLPVFGSTSINGVNIEGSVVADIASGLVCDVSPSRGKANRRLALYAQMVFLNALDPDRPWRGMLIGKGEGKDKSKVLVVEMGPLGDSAQERLSQASERLADLVALHELGMRVPLPIFTETSFAWQSTPESKRFKAAAQKWNGNGFFGIPGEGDDDATRMLFPQLDSFDDVTASEFPKYAERLWTPILEICTESTR